MVRETEYREYGVDVLLFEDEPADAELIGRFLDKNPEVHFFIDWAERLSAGLERLSKKSYDIIICDLGLPDSRGLDTFSKIHAASPDTPIIVLSALEDERVGLQTVQRGAQDYLVKGKIHGEVLVKVIRYALERQRIRTDLIDRIAQVEKLERERESMLSMLAHDIKNSLVPAEAFIDRILSGKSAKMREHLERTLSELKSIEHLAASFSEFTRMKTRGYMPQASSCDLDALIRGQIELALTKAEKKHIQIRNMTSPGMPAVEADEALIKRVIMNLLDNAVKYTADGGSIVVQTFEVDDELRIEVQDTGEGIPPDRLPFIFDAFYRGSGDQKGSGLGLTIAKGIVEAHGGRIWVASNPETGSMFGFSLPKRPDAARKRLEKAA